MLSDKANCAVKCLPIQHATPFSKVFLPPTSPPVIPCRLPRRSSSLRLNARGPWPEALSTDGGKRPMIVSMWMAHDVVTIEPQTPITQIMALFLSRRIRRAPVVEQRPDGPHLVGLVSTADLFRAFPPHVNPFTQVAPPEC